jgi:ketosteroid isomerase-like protein
MEGYWNSDSLLFTSGGRIQRGWNATLEKYRTSYASRSRMGRLTFSSVDVHILGPDGAWVFGRWEIARDPDPAGGVFTLVFKRFGDVWKIVHDHTSTDPPDTTTTKP